MDAVSRHVQAMDAVSRHAQDMDAVSRHAHKPGLVEQRIKIVKKVMSYVNSKRIQLPNNRFPRGITHLYRCIIKSQANCSELSTDFKIQKQKYQKSRICF